MALELIIHKKKNHALYSRVAINTYSNAHKAKASRVNTCTFNHQRNMAFISHARQPYYACHPNQMHVNVIMHDLLYCISTPIQ